VKIVTAPTDPETPAGSFIETTLVLSRDLSCDLDAGFDPTHRERLEEAIAEARAAVARLERAMEAAARPAPVRAAA
jgi:hypothetical protein